MVWYSGGKIVLGGECVVCVCVRGVCVVYCVVWYMCYVCVVWCMCGVVYVWCMYVWCGVCVVYVCVVIHVPAPGGGGCSEDGLRGGGRHLFMPVPAQHRTPLETGLDIIDSEGAAVRPGWWT